MDSIIDHIFPTFQMKTMVYFVSEDCFFCSHRLPFHAKLWAESLGKVNVLGWTVGGQIKGYATGLRRRLSCSIISRMVR